MATRKRSNLEEELMTDANISKVIRLLEPKEEGVKPITKKDACQMLGMAYNTTRLNTIIENFKATQERNAKRRAELRGKPASKDDIIFIISEYLAGEPVDAISKSTYRSTSFIKKILEDHNVPVRVPGASYFKPELIPDGAMRDKFNIEVVFSARYSSLAKVHAEYDHPVHKKVYRVWLMDDKWKEFAYQPVEELASMEDLRTLGVRV